MFFSLYSNAAQSTAADDTKGSHRFQTLHLLFRLEKNKHQNLQTTSKYGTQTQNQHIFSKSELFKLLSKIISEKYLPEMCQN